MLRLLLGGLLLAATTSGARAGTDDSTTMQFLRRAEYERVAISPQGNALAIACHHEEAPSSRWSGEPDQPIPD